MAKSTGYFGLRRGSTKSHTFQVIGGKQITKDRVEGGKNPRTLRQMKARCIMATVGSAYSAMKAICDHSFQGVSAGRACMARFMELNASYARLAANQSNGYFGFNKWGIKGMMPGSYQISDGTLPSICPNLSTLSIDGAAKTATIDVAYGRSVAEICEELGVEQYGDMATICVAYKRNDGSYGFGAARLTFKQGSDVASSFDLAIDGDFVAASINYASTQLKLVAKTAFDWADGADAEHTYTAAIASHYRNDKYLYSKAQFDVQDAAPSYAEAIQTYPVGAARFLNGDGNTQDNGGSAPVTPSEPSNPVVTDPALTIQKNGTGTATVTHSGTTLASGATVPANDEVEIVVTPASGFTPTATLNGQSVELTQSGDNYEGSFLMPAANAVLSIVTSGGSGADQN
jgi:hypothetical protein